MIQMNCPQCGKELHIDEKYAGQMGQCNKCHRRITVPRIQKKPGLVDGVHYAQHVDRVKQLKKQGELQSAELLLLRLVDAVEEESRKSGHGVAPWYYEQLAIIYRKNTDLLSEIEILERYKGQQKAPGVGPAKLEERLNKALQRAAARAATRQIT